MLLTILVFILMLSVLVMVHELGHFVAAKKFGIKVEEFGFGLPPRAWGKKIGETIYSINWLPIGGFVKLYGEDREDGAPVTKDRNRAFYSRPIWQRIIVLVAGVTMNFLLAVVVISYLFVQGVQVPVERVHIEQVEKGSPAEAAGLKPDDIIRAVGGQSIKSSSDFTSYVKGHVGEEIVVDIERGIKLTHVGDKLNECNNCQRLSIKLIPRKNPPEQSVKKTEEEPDMIGAFIRSIKQALHIGTQEETKKEVPKQGPIGVVISSFETRIYPWYQAPVYGTWEALKLSWLLVEGIGTTLWKLITFQSVGRDVAGPIGIAEMTGQARRMGLSAVLELMGLLSLNLAIVNILPFPALDGGRLLFVLIEAITGKKLKTDLERYVHQIGMMILLLLIVLITVNDFVRIFTR